MDAQKILDWFLKKDSNSKIIVLLFIFLGIGYYDRVEMKDEIKDIKVECSKDKNVLFGKFEEMVDEKNQCIEEKFEILSKQSEQWRQRYEDVIMEQHR